MAVTYTLIAHYWMAQVREVPKLPTVSAARRRISMLLEDGAEEVELFAVDGERARLLEVVSRKPAEKCWN